MLNRTTSKLFALVAACALIGSACNQAETEQPVKAKEVERNITIAVSGARQADFTGRYRVKVITRIGKKEQKPNSAAAIEPLGRLALPDGTLLRVDVAVVGQYTGDGKYTTPAGVGIRPRTGPTVAAPTTSIATSVAAITFIKVGPPSQETRFGYLLEPCTITLKDGAGEGSADCPKLVSFDGEQVSLKYSWSK